MLANSNEEACQADRPVSASLNPCIVVVSYHPLPLKFVAARDRASVRNLAALDSLWSAIVVRASLIFCCFIVEVRILIVRVMFEKRIAHYLSFASLHINTRSFHHLSSLSILCGPISYAAIVPAQL